MKTNQLVQPEEVESPVVAQMRSADCIEQRRTINKAGVRISSHRPLLRRVFGGGLQLFRSGRRDSLVFFRISFRRV
jgi:hypothetical protein